MQLRHSPFLVALLGFLASGSSACGRGHGLGVESTTSTSGGGGAATSSAATSGAGGASNGSSSAGSGGTSEPPGPTRVTVVNGVNDYGAIRICFLPYPAGDPAAKPWPAAASGLPFAHAAVLDLAVDIPAGVDVRPTILAGDLDKITGMTCAQAIALAGSGGNGGNGGAGGSAGPPPPIVAAALAVLPAPIFKSEKSLLLAPIGCMGGPGHDDASENLACGFGYTSATPTVDLLALGMSRKTDPVHVALQVVNASIALQPTDIGFTPAIQEATNHALAIALPTGGIQPKPPFTKLPVGALGPLDKVSINTYLPNQGMAFTTSQTPLSEAFQNGTVSATQVADGEGYVLVAVGSYPGIPAGPFWHQLTYALIKANP